MVEPFPLIEVTGPPRERGRQYGRQAAERIALGIRHYSQQLAGSRFGDSAIAEFVHAYLPHIEAFEPAYVEEMRGIAEGAGVDFESVAMLNARTEILKLGRDPALRRRLAGEEACTGVRVRRDDGPDLLTFTEAGGLARSGFNAAGVAITANYLECDRDYRRPGVPLALIRRKVLESQHLALAMRCVYSTPKSAANNMIVSHAEGGVAIDFECAPDETFQVHPEQGLLVHANHFVSPVALTKLRDTGIATTPDSLYRDVRVRTLLAPQIARLTREAVKAALLDDFATPWSVCRPPRPGVTGVMTATVAMVVMEPALGVMEIAPLPALGGRFTEYQLEVVASAPHHDYPVGDRHA
jgi:isopenicillin-N N-acyltransferase like protein